MNALILYKKHAGEDPDIAANREVREAVKYATSRNMTVLETIEITDDNRVGLLYDIACLMALSKSPPNALLVYDLSHLQLPYGHEDIFRPIVEAGFIEIHIIRYGISFTENSPPEQLKEGGFAQFEDQLFWAKYFEDYDESLKKY